MVHVRRLYVSMPPSRPSAGEQCMSLTQDTRITRLTTPDVGTEPLVFRLLTAYERISSPFEFRVLALTEAPIENSDDLLGEACHVTHYGESGPLRTFHGTCAEVSYAGTTRGGIQYELTLRPDFWFLSRNRDCRIFQSMTVVEILDDVLRKRGRISKCEFKLDGTYPKRDYCVQYRESDFEFASRLMEEEGIFYFFRHTEQGHTMVVADRKSVHAAVPGYEEIPYFPPAANAQRERDHLDEWAVHHRAAAATVRLADYNFTKPEVIVEKKTEPEAHTRDTAEALDFPGGFATKGEATRITALRLEAERALRVVAIASGSAVGLSAGAKFKLTGEHPIMPAKNDFVLVETRHRIEGDDFHSGGVPASPPRVDIIAIPEATPFRKAQETPRPRILGTQTAVVTGTPGEEIETDEYGRIRVIFHWDTYTNSTRPSSCWIRVAQIMAGKNWGAVFTPRIGQEVLVDFLDGDPDHPIVTGVVYNKANMPPYALPANKTRSTMKTDSSKGGGGFNELRFEDKKGSEELYMHAQKDMNIKVLNNLSTTVDKDETRLVTQNRTTTVDKGDEKFIMKMGNRTETLEMGNDKTQLKMGNQSVKLDLGKQDTEAMQSIEFKVGQSSIKIDQMGVTIKGMMITVDGQIMTTVKGLMTKVEGTAMLTAKGGLVMIN
jgi:type VI secretion system secreted protein VgrG